MSTTFPRVFEPEQVSDLAGPDVLRDISHSGIINVRLTKRVGWWWEEKYGPINIRDADAMIVKALIEYSQMTGEVLDIKHLLVPGSGMTPNGLGTSGILVFGALQTGNAIITDQWPVTTNNCVRSGDVIKLAGDNAVYRVRADANSNGSGQVTIPIVPNLRSSPADDAAVATTDVEFSTIIWNKVRFPQSASPAWFIGLDVIFAEFL